jgi:apolipoprotein N-acyltransferase
VDPGAQSNVTPMRAPTTTGAPVDRRGAGTGVRAVAALVAGACICLSVPPWGWWPLAFVGIALWVWLLDGQSAWRRFGLSYLVGIVWFGPSTLWMWRLTAPGYVAAVFLGWGTLVGLVGVGATRDQRRVLLLPAGIVLFEWFHTHAPFGGIPLSMLATTQAAGPLRPVAAIGGSLLLGGAVAALGSATYLTVRGRWRAAGLILVAVVLTALVGLAVPLGDDAGSIRVAAVQGGGPQGTRFAEADTEPVLARHLAASAGIEPGSVDLVVWPENVVNIEGPFEEHPWAGRLRREATRIGAPILVGVVEGVGGTEFVNYVVVVNPDGSITGRFDKERRVPFGEYVPLRPLFETFAAGQLPPRDQIPGVGTAMVPTSAGDAAVAISWEVFFARRVREGVRAGGEFVTNPTNGSSYWLTQVQSQQIAQSQLRATESGRWLVQAAPTGFSAVVGPRGELLQRSDVGEAVVLEATIERLRSTTPAQATGDLIPMALAGGVVFSFLTAEWMRRRSEVPART